MSLKITINLTNKWFFSLALAILILILGIGVLAVNGVFHPASEISPGTFQAGNYIFPGNITASNIGGCYTIYGSHSCAPGYQTVLTGRLGGIENYFPDVESSGRPRNGLVCIEDDVPSLNHYGSYYNRLLRSNDAGNGMDSINTSCAICCKGGIYTVFGTNTCAPGYQKLYEGRAGGIEQHRAPEKYLLQFDNTADIYDTRYGETLCLDITAPYIQRWSSSRYGYHTRLMRYTSNGIGMDRVNSTCAVCGWSGY